MARPVHRKERLQMILEKDFSAEHACDREWTRLRGGQADGPTVVGTVGPDKPTDDSPCWDETLVEEWSDVQKRAKGSGPDANMGRLVELCFEKNAELPMTIRPAYSRDASYSRETT